MLKKVTPTQGHMKAAATPVSGGKRMPYLARRPHRGANLGVRAGRTHSEGVLGGNT